MALVHQELRWNSLVPLYQTPFHFNHLLFWFTKFLKMEYFAVAGAETVADFGKMCHTPVTMWRAECRPPQVEQLYVSTPSPRGRILSSILILGVLRGPSFLAASPPICPPRGACGVGPVTEQVPLHYWAASHWHYITQWPATPWRGRGWLSARHSQGHHALHCLAMAIVLCMLINHLTLTFYSYSAKNTGRFRYCLHF